jgi:hypothetical protein
MQWYGLNSIAAWTIMETIEKEKKKQVLRTSNIDYIYMKTANYHAYAADMIF